MDVRLNWQVATNGQGLDGHREFLDSRGGLYVWIWNGKPPRVIYIGEARNFTNRFKTHMSKLLGGEYTVFRMARDDDFIEFVKTNYAGKTFEEMNDQRAIYIPTTEKRETLSFSRAFFDQEECNQRVVYMQNHTYAFATVEGDCPPKQKQIEGALIDMLSKEYEKRAGVSLMRKGGKSNATLIGNINQYPGTSLSIEHTGEAVSSLPAEFRAITRYSVQSSP